MKTSEILTKAAEIMIEKGHCSDALHGEDGSVCLMGALIDVGGLFVNGVLVTRQPAWLYLEQALACEPVEWNFDATEAMALGALHEAALLAKAQND